MSYPIILSKIKKDNNSYIENFQYMEQLTKTLKNKIYKNSFGGGKKILNDIQVKVNYLYWIELKI